MKSPSAVGIFLLASFVAFAAPAAPAVVQPERFTIDGNTVIDEKTGLRWQRCSVGQTWRSDNKCIGKEKLLTFSEAQRLNDWSEENARWRVPTKNELETLVDKTAPKFNINTEAFPDVNEKNSTFWTSDMYDGGQAWYVEFTIPNVTYISGDHANYTDQYSLRLVHLEK